MAMVRPSFSQLMQTGLRKLYLETEMLEQRAEEFPTLFNVETSTKQYEQDVKMAGMGPLQEKPEATAVAYQDMIQGGSIRYLHLTYALAALTSKELMDDDQYGVIKKIPQALARSTRFTRESVAFAILNQGFSNTVTTTDGVSLFNNEHPLLGGVAATNLGPGLQNVVSAAGTYPNRPPTDLDFSVGALQLATAYFDRLVDAQGMPVTLKPKYVVIPTELKFLAREILGSSGKPGSSDNDINSILAEDYEYIAPHYLTSATAWFLICEKKQHQMNVFIREAPNTSFDDDFDTDGIRQKTRTRMSAGATDWYGTFGSNGM